MFTGSRYASPRKGTVPRPPVNEDGERISAKEVSAKEVTDLCRKRLTDMATQLRALAENLPDVSADMLWEAFLSPEIMYITGVWESVSVSHPESIDTYRERFGDIGQKLLAGYSSADDKRALISRFNSEIALPLGIDETKFNLHWNFAVETSKGARVILPQSIDDYDFQDWSLINLSIFSFDVLVDVDIANELILSPTEPRRLPLTQRSFLSDVYEHSVKPLFRHLSRIEYATDVWFLSVQVDALCPQIFRHSGFLMATVDKVVMVAQHPAVQPKATSNPSDSIRHREFVGGLVRKIIWSTEPLPELLIEPGMSSPDACTEIQSAIEEFEPTGSEQPEQFVYPVMTRRQLSELFLRIASGGAGNELRDEQYVAHLKKTVEALVLLESLVYGMVVEKQRPQLPKSLPTSEVLFGVGQEWTHEGNSRGNALISLIDRAAVQLEVSDRRERAATRIEAERLAEEQRNLQRQQRGEARRAAQITEYFEKYQDPKIGSATQARIATLGNAIVTATKQAAHDRIKDAIEMLRIELLDRRGALEPEAGKLGDDNIDTLAELLFEGRNIAAVLKSHDFDPGKFDLQLDAKTPSPANLAALASLACQSESVRACLDKILEQADKDSLLFLGALTLNVPDLKMLMSADEEALLNFRERIREVIRGETAVASVKTKVLTRNDRQDAGKASLPEDFWGAVGQDESDWSQASEGGAITLTRISDGVSVTIGKKALKQINRAVNTFQTRLPDAVVARQCDGIIESLEGEGFIVSSSEEQLTIKHSGAQIEQKLSDQVHDRLSQLYDLDKKMAPYRQALDSLYRAADAAGIPVVEQDDSGEDLASHRGERVVKLPGYPPTFEMIEGAKGAITELITEQIQAEDEAQEARARLLLAEQALKNPVDGRVMILDTTILINLSARGRDESKLALLKELADEGIQLLVPSSVVFECTGQQAIVGEERSGATLKPLVRFQYGADCRKLFRGASIMALDSEGTVIKCSCGPNNWSQGGIVIIEQPADRLYLQSVARARRGYERQGAETPGTLYDYLRSQRLLSSGAGDFSIRCLEGVLTPRGSDSQNNRKLIVCSDDQGVWRDSNALAYGTRDLISYLLQLDQGRESSSGARVPYSETELLEWIAWKQGARFRRYLQNQSSLRERPDGAGTIAEYFAD